MPVRITLDAVLLSKGMTGKELSHAIDISETQISLFRSSKVRGIRFSTLARMCAVLDCAPGDLLGYSFSEDDLLPGSEQISAELRCPASESHRPHDQAGE
jgi:putative transcriptional regulator